MTNTPGRDRRKFPATSRALLFTFLGIAMLGVTTPQTPSSLAATQMSSSTQALTRYASSHSLSDLQSAIEPLVGIVDISTLTPDNFTSTRRELVKAWAPVIRAIEQSYDPAFNPQDPKNIQLICVPAPPVGGRTVSEGCIDPNNIKDQKARAAFIASIEENKLRTARFRHYWDIRREDDLAMTHLSMTLDLLRKIAPDGAGADFTALDTILRQAGLSNVRRTTIDSMFYARTGQ